MRDRQVVMDASKSRNGESIKAKRLAAMQGFSELKQEFKRISWTSKAELRAYTKIVIGAIFIVGLGIYVVDLVARGALDGLGGLVRAIFG